jgi:hypothetical protein
VVDCRAPVAWLPTVGSLPLHPPEAVHEVAWVDVQFSVEVPPEAILVGAALSDTLAGGAGGS